MVSHRLNQWGGNYRHIITMYVHRIGFRCRPMYDTLDQTTFNIKDMHAHIFTDTESSSVWTRTNTMQYQMI